MWDKPTTCLDLPSQLVSNMGLWLHLIEREDIKNEGKYQSPIPISLFYCEKDVEIDETCILSLFISSLSCLCTFWLHTFNDCFVVV